MTPQNITDLSAALEEVIAENERVQENLKISARILRAVKLKLIETEQARILLEQKLSLAELGILE